MAFFFLETSPPKKTNTLDHSTGLCSQNHDVTSTLKDTSLGLSGLHRNQEAAWGNAWTPVYPTCHQKDVVFGSFECLEVGLRGNIVIKRMLFLVVCIHCEKKGCKQTHSSELPSWNPFRPPDSCSVAASSLCWPGPRRLEEVQVRASPTSCRVLRSGCGPIYITNSRKHCVS